MTLATIEVEMRLGVALEAQDGSLIVAQDGSNIEDEYEWTSVTSDVIDTEPLKNEWGILGNGPEDRVGGRGVMEFVLDNSRFNSAGLAGYYSPGHANARARFNYGVAARTKYTFGVQVKYCPVGYVTYIEPDIGEFDRQYTRVRCDDYMGLLGKFRAIKKIPLQTGQRTDQVLTTIFSSLEHAPYATSLATGLETLPYALDQAQERVPSARREIQRLMMSTFGYAYIDGDSDYGETFFTQTRTTRITDTDVQATISDLFLDGKVVTEDEDVYDEFFVVATPREAGSVDEVAFSLQTPITLEPGDTLSLLAPYRDPNSNEPVSVVSLTIDSDNMVVASDFAFGSTEGDGSSDLGAHMTIEATTGSLESELDIAVSSDCPSTGYLNVLNLNGLLIRHFDEIRRQRTVNTGRITANTLTLNLDYLADVNDITAILDLLEARYSTDIPTIKELEFNANSSSDLMNLAVSVGLGKRITAAETQTGINRDYFINGKRLVRTQGDRVDCTLWVERAYTDTPGF